MMTSPSARARSAVGSIVPSHLTWLCSCDLLQPCVAFHGPADLIDLLFQYSSSQFHVIRAEYGWKLPERSPGSDDEDNDSNSVPDSQTAAGIIYSTWFMNRLVYVPALCVLLFRWETNDSFTNIRKLISDYVRTFRQNNQTRSGGLMVVIMKISAPLEDDVLLERHVLTIRDDLGLAEDFVIVSQSFRLTQSIERLVSQIKENSIASYSNCIKTLKRKRSKLGRQSHIFTLIRYHIKLGFYAFLSQDINAAKKYFNSAHKDLVEMEPLSIFQLIEIRDIGLIVNALICRLLILSEDIPGAIDQFDRHICLMSKMQSDDPFSKPLAFTFYSWLQQEYLIMGALMQGNMAHCLRFVNSAANALSRRMECTMSLPEFDSHYSDQLKELMQRAPFYCGQIQRYDQFESDNALSLDLFLLTEWQYRSSSNAISLLTVAHNLLLAYPRKRLRQIALSELRIARQLIRECNYSAALPLFEKSLNFFRKEGWMDLLRAILRDVRAACISLGLFRESIVYTCQLIASVSDGSTATLQKELTMYACKLQEIVDISSTGVVEISQEPGKISVSSKFSPPVIFDSIVVFHESGTSQELCRDVSLSRANPVCFQLEMLNHAYAVLALKNATFRAAIRQVRDCHYRRSGAVKVKTNLESSIVFVQELFPLSLTVENTDGYDCYSFNCIQDNVIVDENSCEPIVHPDPVSLPPSDPLAGNCKVVKSFLYCRQPADTQALFRLYGDHAPFFEHEVSWRVINPLEISESFISLSFSDQGHADPGHYFLPLGYPAIFNLQLRNMSALTLHIIEVFFDHDESVLEMKQAPAQFPGKVEPGGCITLQFILVPIKLCTGMRPGQIRFNWRRSQPSCIQTFVTPVSTSISVSTAALHADVYPPNPEDIYLGKPCILTIQLRSCLSVTRQVNISTDVPKSIYHVVGPIKSTLWVPPNDCLTLKWTLYPVQPGFQPLPAVKISSDSGQCVLSEKPLGNIFVQPSCIGENVNVVRH